MISISDIYSMVDNIVGQKNESQLNSLSRDMSIPLSLFFFAKDWAIVGSMTMSNDICSIKNAHLVQSIPGNLSEIYSCAQNGITKNISLTKIGNIKFHFKIVKIIVECDHSKWPHSI